MNNNPVRVTFTHSRDGGSFVANINPQCTGQMAIQGLILGNEEDGPFLQAAPPGRPYELVVKRSQVNITPNMTFEQADVQDDDVIEVRQRGQGA
jgi:hypothetical protein